MMYALREASMCTLLSRCLEIATASVNSRQSLTSFASLEGAVRGRFVFGMFEPQQSIFFDGVISHIRVQ